MNEIAIITRAFILRLDGKVIRFSAIILSLKSQQ